nr:GEM-like protein 1 [Malus domestica]
MANMVEALCQCGKMVEVATRRAEAKADNVWNHLRTCPSFTVRTCPSFTDVMMARLNTGTKVLTAEAEEKVFQQTFENMTGEKLLHSYACYLSTSHGPVIGMLYISDNE